MASLWWPYLWVTSDSPLGARIHQPSASGSSPQLELSVVAKAIGSVCPLKDAAVVIHRSEGITEARQNQTTSNGRVYERQRQQRPRLNETPPT